MRAVFSRVKVQLIGIFAIFIITLVTFAAVKPELLKPRTPVWTITGNAIADRAIFDSHISLENSCAEIEEPVCGTDGTTYRNLCEARKAGTDLLHLGGCDESWQRVG